jgi:hypothetical protein
VFVSNTDRLNIIKSTINIKYQIGEGRPQDFNAYSHRQVDFEIWFIFCHEIILIEEKHDSEG